jgi:hypothetical protein
MAFKHGKGAGLSLNAVVLSTFIHEMETSFDTDLADTTTFGATWKAGLTGISGGKLDISGYYDPTATTGPGAVLFPLLTSGTAVTGLIYPGGNSTGQSLYTVTASGTNGCIVLSYTETSPVSGIVAFQASIAITVLPLRSVI